MTLDRFKQSWFHNNYFTCKRYDVYLLMSRAMMIAMMS